MPGACPVLARRANAPPFMQTEIGLLVSVPRPRQLVWHLIRLTVRCVCVCVCVICTIYEVDPYAAMRWQVYSAQSAVASLRL